MTATAACLCRPQGEEHEQHGVLDVPVHTWRGTAQEHTGPFHAGALLRRGGRQAVSLHARLHTAGSSAIKQKQFCSLLHTRLVELQMKLFSKGGTHIQWYHSNIYLHTHTMRIFSKLSSSPAAIHALDWCLCCCFFFSCHRALRRRKCWRS